MLDAILVGRKPRMKAAIIRNLIVIVLLAAPAALAAGDRVTGNVEPARRATLKGHLHPSARAAFDQGLADPALPIQYATVYLRPADGLEGFLTELQNPLSPSFHKWMTPEQ